MEAASFLGRNRFGETVEHPHWRCVAEIYTSGAEFAVISSLNWLTSPVVRLRRDKSMSPMTKTAVHNGSWIIGFSDYCENLARGRGHWWVKVEGWIDAKSAQVIWPLSAGVSWVPRFA